MKKIEEIKYKVGMSENEHNLACKLNEIIRHLNEKEEEIEVYTSAIENYKKPLSHFFKPEIGEIYYHICFGEVQKTDYDNGWEEDINNILTGNCYRTREEAQLALDKQQALVRLWDWADKNAPFTPEWGDFEEDKFFPVYDYEEGQLEITFEFDRKIQSLLPYFKSEEDCEKFIKECDEDLLLILK